MLGDVCKALDLKLNNGSYYKHAERLDDDEKRTVARAIVENGPSTLKGEGLPAPVGASVLIISESGLYNLIFTSKKAEATAFKKWVTAEVLPSIRRTGQYRAGGRGLPAFVRRFNENWDRVSPGYFSVISELTIRLYGRLEQVGFVMADKAASGKELRPDVSVGRLFSSWLKEHHPDRAADFKEYLHWTPAIEIPARQYPMDMLAHYIDFVDNVWLREHAVPYFKERDPLALEHLPKLLPEASRHRPVVGKPKAISPQPANDRRKKAG